MNKIRHYRLKANLSQRQLAEELGDLYPSAISNYENGIREPRDLALCYRILFLFRTKKGLGSLQFEDLYPPEGYLNKAS